MTLPDDLAQVRRLHVLMVVRLVLAVLGLGGVLAADLAVERLAFEAGLIYAVFGFALGINALYLPLVRRGRPPLVLQAWLQVMLDVLLVSALVYLTGIGQVFIYLYFATVIAGALLTGGAGGGLLTASVATIQLSAISFVYQLAADDPVGFRLPLIGEEQTLDIAPVRFLVPYLVSFGLSLHVVAGLTGYLVREARRFRILHEEVLTNLVDGVLAIDHNNVIAFANPAALEMLGAPDGLRDRSVTDALPDEVRRAVVEARLGGANCSARLQLGGRPVEVAVRRLISGPLGGSRGVLVRLSDVSLHDQLVRVTAGAERSRALLEMSASMAHEIRNPLASIRAAANELSDLPASGEDDRRLLAVMVRESDRLNKIISDFLEFAGDRRLEIAPCDVSAVVKEVALMLAAREECRSGAVAVEAETPDGMTARADADRLKQVVLNLGINALEAVGPRGAVRLQVRRVADRIQPAEPGERHEGLLIEVTDTGPGISPENQPRIYDPFFTTKPRGTGMGLAIARKIVREHEGQLVVENRAAGGASARVWLPF